jgi:hypothetical protein
LDDFLDQRVCGLQNEFTLSPSACHGGIGFNWKYYFGIVLFCAGLLNRLLKNSFLIEKYANIPMNLWVNFQIHGFFIILLKLSGATPAFAAACLAEVLRTEMPKARAITIASLPGAGFPRALRFLPWFLILVQTLSVSGQPTNISPRLRTQYKSGKWIRRRHNKIFPSACAES